MTAPAARIAEIVAEGRRLEAACRTACDGESAFASELRRLVADFGREAARQEREWNKSKRDREWYEAVVWRAAQEKVRKAMRRAAEREERGKEKGK